MTNPFEVDTSYNPFAVENTPEDVPQTSYAPPPATPVYDTPSYTPPQTNYTTPTQSYTNSQEEFKDSITGLKITAEDLAKREEALAKREATISAMETKVEEARANGTMANLHPRNYPFILKWYKYYPEEEIPENARSLIKQLYWAHYAGWLLLAINFGCCFFTFAPGISAMISSPTFTCILAAAYFFLIGPITIDMCFMVLYNAISQKKALKFVGFLFTYGISFLFFAFVAISYDDYGSIGWINAINFFQAKESSYVAIVGLVFSSVASLYTCYHGWLWWVALIYFRKNKFEKAALTEAAGIAANYAAEHKDELAEAAYQNPELMSSAAATAYNFA